MENNHHREERRLDRERRKFTYAFHVPERRNGRDRRFALVHARKNENNRSPERFTVLAHS